MTLKQYKEVLAALPPEWDSMLVQQFCDDQSFYHDPRVPKTKMIERRDGMTFENFTPVHSKFVVL